MERRARIDSLREEAARLRAWGAGVQADTLERVVALLEADLSEEEAELLSPAEAAEYTGLSDRTLRQKVADGHLANHGRPGKPLYRRSELPRRATPTAGAGAQGHGYDAAADAAALFARQRKRA